MKRTEAVYREILYRAIEKKQFLLTQSELSRKLEMSLSIINSAVKKLVSIGAVEIRQRSFRVVDVKKILYFWASIRNLEKDIVFKCRIEMSVREIERAMPDVLFACYSAYKLMFKDVPADYSEVYVYADENETNNIKKRLKDMMREDRKPNFFVLKKDSILGNYQKMPVAQIFVDLWNLKEWYARDFLNEIEKKIGGI